MQFFFKSVTVPLIFLNILTIIIKLILGWYPNKPSHPRSPCTYKSTKIKVQFFKILINIKEGFVLIYLFVFFYYFEYFFKYTPLGFNTNLLCFPWSSWIWSDSQTQCCIASIQGYREIAKSLCRYGRQFNGVWSCYNFWKMMYRFAFLMRKAQTVGHPSMYWPQAMLLKLDDHQVH